MFSWAFQIAGVNTTSRALGSSSLTLSKVGLEETTYEFDWSKNWVLFH